MLNERIVTALAVTLQLTGTRLSEPAMEVMAERLSSFPDERQVLSALDRCQTELRHPICLADVYDRIADGRPGPEEAWAMVARVSEDDTVVWTDEMAEAWAACRFVLDDRVAARMAFLETYRDRLAVARSRGRTPRWFVYLGHDPERRAESVLRALEDQRISVVQARAALPEYLWPAEWRKALPEGPAAEPVRLADVAALVQQVTRRLGADRPTEILPAADEGSLRQALEERWREPR